MKNLSKEQAWGLGGHVAVSAVRYCLGRKNYIVSECQEWLCAIWDELPEKAKVTIQCDVEEAFRRHDEYDNRCSVKEYHCDRRNWERVRALWLTSVDHVYMCKL